MGFYPENLALLLFSVIKLITQIFHIIGSIYNNIPNQMNLITLTLLLLSALVSNGQSVSLRSPRQTKTVIRPQEQSQNNVEVRQTQEEYEEIKDISEVNQYPMRPVNLIIRRSQIRAKNHTASSDRQFLTVSPSNLLFNGAFEEQGYFYPYYWKIYRQVLGWEVSSAEIGSGVGYNKKWGNINVAELDIDKNVAYHLPLQAKPGNYYIAFDWAPRIRKPLQTSQIELRWNGAHFLTLIPTEDQIFTQSMAFKSFGEKNKLTFTGAGKSDGNGASISNVRVYATQDQIEGLTFFEGYRRQNLIRNGNFELVIQGLPQLRSVSLDQVQNWNITNGKLRKGSFHSSSWDPITNVAELDPKVNAQYATKFHATQLVYLMSFDFAPCEGQRLSTSQFSIYLNGNFFLKINPSVHKVQRHFMTLFVQENTNNTLSFKGEGPSDGKGATIDNIEVHAVSNKETEYTKSEERDEKITNGQSLTNVQYGDRKATQHNSTDQSPQSDVAEAVLESAVGFNLVENGQFADKGTCLAGKQLYHTRYVTGWQVQVADIGPDRIFNSKWGKDTNVAELDVDHNTAYHLPLKLAEGNYYVLFDWAPSEHGPLGTSKIDIKWNQNLITTLSPAHNEILTQLMAFKSSGNESILTLVGAGKSDGVGAGITNIRVFAALDTSELFQQWPLQRSDFVLRASFQRSSLVQKRGIRNFLSEGTEIKFKGYSTMYVISFNFLPSLDRPLTQLKLSLSLNDKQVLIMLSNKHEIQHHFLAVKGRKGDNTLVFKTGQPDAGDRRNATIANIQVHQISDREPVDEYQPSENNRFTVPKRDQSSEAGVFLLRVTPKNLMLNGAFEMEVVPQKKGKPVNYLQNWFLSNQGEIGQGYRYNMRWLYTVVAKLDARENTEYSTPLLLSPGVYYAAFDLAPHSNQSLETSQLSIRWNGNQILCFQPSSESIFTQQIIFRSEGKKTLNMLTIEGKGASDGIGATFSNVRIYKIELMPQQITAEEYKALSLGGCLRYSVYQQVNLIWNGDFEKLPPVNNRLGSHYFTGESLPEWSVKGQGEVGIGSRFNSDWDPKDYVVELDSKQNTEYTTMFTPVIGDQTTYYLSFDFAPRKYFPFETSQFSVKLNEEFLFSIVPKTQQVQRQFVKMTGYKGRNTLSFKGEGSSDGRGAAINNVEVRRA